MSDRNGPGLPDDGPFGTSADIDFDLSVVHADDEYLDLLGGANLDDPDGVPDDQLSALLMSWRRDVEAEPIGELVDQKLATVTVHAARARRQRRPRLLVPVAAAAAVLAIAFAGMGLMARDAHPGDTLWALTKVLYSDHARSVEAAASVKADLREAEAALTQGDLAVAKSKLEAAHAALPTVSNEDGQDVLKQQHASLMAQLPGNPSGEAPAPPSPKPSTAPGSDTGGGPGSGTNPGSASPTAPSAPSTSSPPASGGTSPPSATSSQPPTNTSRIDPGTIESNAPGVEPNGGSETARDTLLGETTGEG